MVIEGMLALTASTYIIDYTTKPPSNKRETMLPHPIFV